MKQDTSHVLSSADGRDESALRAFIQTRISPNAWPIHSPALRRSILEKGVDLGAVARFTMDLDDMERLVRDVYTRMRRVERALGIDNAFHCALHNHEVLVRLLLIEWPDGLPMPPQVREGTTRLYRTIEDIVPVIRIALAAMLEGGVPPSVLARDLLSAVGHDYGHTGSSERLDSSGRRTPLTHEEMSEKHVAPIGLAFGMPVALVLESIAGIRATTFHPRPGRAAVQAFTDFERKLTVADVMGCALPPHLWLTHVGVPVLAERLPGWRRRHDQIPEERRQLDTRLATSSLDEVERTALLAEREALVQEDMAITKDVGEWFRRERGFFLYIESNRLSLVPGARDLWGRTLRKKIELIGRVLERGDLLEPLVEQGMPMLQTYAKAVANAEDFMAVLTNDSLDPRLRELISLFAPREGEPDESAGYPS